MVGDRRDVKKYINAGGDLEVSLLIVASPVDRSLRILPPRLGILILNDKKHKRGHPWNGTVRSQCLSSISLIL